MRPACLEGAWRGKCAKPVLPNGLKLILSKLFLCPPVEQSHNLEFGVEPYLEVVRTARANYRELLLERMRAPDGSYEDGLVVPGPSPTPPKKESKTSDLGLNNPLSLHQEVCYHSLHHQPVFHTSVRTRGQNGSRPWNSARPSHKMSNERQWLTTFT